MTELKQLFEALGYANVETFIASGNVIFEAKTTDGAKLEQRIEQHLATSLGYAVDTFVRSEAEVVAAQQFQAFATGVPDGGAIYVTFLKEPLSVVSAKRLIACRTDVDEFQVHGREIYWRCLIKSSDSKVWASPELKAIKLPTGTMRNLTSLTKLVAKHRLFAMKQSP